MVKSIEIKLPHPRNFNPSICDFNGKRYMAYRAEDPDNGFLARIYICALNENFEASESVLVDIGQPQPATNLFEDPRLFVHEGKLGLSFIAASCKTGPHFACQGICWLNEKLEPELIYYPYSGKNRNDVCTGNGLLTREKNWTFFSKDGGLFYIYSINPFKVYQFGNELEEICSASYKTKWAWGPIHGSTPLVDLGGGKRIGVMHSFRTSSDRWANKKMRNYHAGFYMVDVNRMELTHMAAKPFLSAIPDESMDIRPKTQPYRPNAIFPCGLIYEKGNFLVSYGWQDCRAMIAKVPEKEAFETMIPVKKL